MSCNLAYVLRNYVKPLMQTLSNDVKDYYLRLLTTKCLNTAIMLGIFMVGYKKTKEIADFCDTVATRKRHSDNLDDNPTVLKHFKQDVLNKKTRSRYFYYIMLTDGNFVKSNGTTVYFPGHVFVIEKLPGAASYNMYQSYINQYDLDGHITKTGNNTRISYEKMQLLLEYLDYILNTEIWDEEAVKKWKSFTFVDTTETFLGAKCKGHYFMCFKKAMVKNCMAHIRKYTKNKLKQVKPIALSRPQEIYGYHDKYDKNTVPLTNIQMYKQLNKLYIDIKSFK
jgi:hypothetical protein